MKKSSVLPSLILLGSVGLSQAQLSAYLPAQGQLELTPTYVFQTYDEFWAGKTKVDLGAATGSDRQYQHTGSVLFEYGLGENLALDLTLGYTTAAFENGPDDSGLADTTFGLRWKVADEKMSGCPVTPTTAIRLGGIIEGTYNENFAFSAGDGASGFETSLIMGKAICTGFGLYGDFGWRTRNHSVPDDLFGSVGVYAATYGFSLSGGYRHIQSLSGGTIGSARFNAGVYGFPQVKEINQLVEASLGYTDAGGRFYSIFTAKNIDGRNTGDKWVAGASITLPLGRN